MTEEQIHYSKVIAEFMGYNIKRYWWHRPTPDLYEKLPSSINEYVSEFHTSYDWLMPVWVKFRDLDMCTKEYSDIRSVIGSMMAYAEIEQTFEELTKAIEWYNSINK